MTQILTKASARSVIQVSDRAVTVDGAPYDILANKVIILLALDAIVCMAYTGPAYFGGVRTDQWIAQGISGMVYEGRPEALRIGIGRTDIQSPNRCRAMGLKPV